MSNVDLPEPDGPTMATYSPGGDREVDTAQRPHRWGAGKHPLDPTQLDDRHVQLPSSGNWADELIDQVLLLLADELRVPDLVLARLIGLPEVELDRRQLVDLGACQLG